MSLTDQQSYQRDSGERLAHEIEALGHRLSQVRASIARVIFGQQQVIEQTLITLLAGGHAQSLAPEGPDGFALTATTTTKLAYVRTGDAELDRLSEAGLYGLSLVLNRRTAAEELAPLGVDLEKDELAFFPLLYWPIDPSQPALSEQAIRKLNDYMKNGGMVLFDTRDQASGGQGLHRLRELAQGLDRKSTRLNSSH